mmetsp:Transcript_19636/g.23841  ORF Transcript_19636/g.23841 Transcript_19636/m.23841 type:complete len:155 (-) Transcript_19636:68-532(-)
MSYSDGVGEYTVDPEEDLQLVSHYFLPLEIPTRSHRNKIKNEAIEKEKEKEYWKQVLKSSYINTFIMDALTLWEQGYQVKDLHNNFNLNAEQDQVQVDCNQAGINEVKEPLLFIQAYLRSVVKGTHILGRHYSFIRATAWNRISFAQQSFAAFR